MLDLLEHCSLHSLSHTSLIIDFDCDHADLNDFFLNDAIKYQEQLLGETFYFKLKETEKIVCAYTISNDSIKVSDLPNSRKKAVTKGIPHVKSMKSFPAVLIGRLGVAKEFKSQGIGTQLIQFIKATVLSEDRNMCRYLLVDSYNTSQALRLYQKNEFSFVFSTEEQEKNYYGKPPEENLKTRFMYFDLKLWSDKLSS